MIAPSFKMQIFTISALSCLVTLTLFQGALASECGFVSRSCASEMRGVNLKGTVLVERAYVNDCTSCIDACELHDQCNVWVYCDNPNGCDNGYGKIFPHKQCTLKRQDDTHAIITAPRGSTVAYSPSSKHAHGSFKDWVSGYCHVCPCCGWCGNAWACCSNYKYCEKTRKCVAGQLSAGSIKSGESSNCKDPNKDLYRTDCVTVPDQCDNVNPLCPAGSKMFDGIGWEDNRNQ